MTFGMTSMAKKRKKAATEPIDLGSDRLHKQHTVVPRLTRGMNGYNMKVMDETEIDRLLLHEVISVNEHSTLERFLRRLHKVGFVGMRSPDYSSPIHADATAVGDKRALAVKGITALIAELDQTIGAGKRQYLVALVTEDRPWPDKYQSLRDAIAALDRIIG